MFRPQPVQVNCPQCRRPFAAQIWTIVDVGLQPELKEQLLRGRLNSATCPFCGHSGVLGTPLLYHDPSRELLLCLAPMDAAMKREDQEKLIGSLTNRLMDALPPERRKAYLFQPQTVFTFERLAEEIYLAEGITREMLNEQAQRARLIQDLLDRLGDDERLRELAESRLDELTYEFFLMLNASIEATWEEGDEIGVKRLARLRERLLELTGSPPQTMPGRLPAGAIHQQVIDALLEAKGDDELRSLVAVNRPRLDYTFFLALTNEIETARGARDAAQAERLLDLRSKLLAITDQLDREMQEATQRAADLLRRIVTSSDPQQVIADNIEQVDELFLYVLSANIAQARADRHEPVAETLESVYDQILVQLQERMPPEIRLVNRLLWEDDRAKWEGILHEEPAVVNRRLVSLVEAMAEDARLGRDGELTDRLREIAQKIVQVLEGTP